eukprot:5373919-Pleurochrysis_carterae.AAC.1
MRHWLQSPPQHRESLRARNRVRSGLRHRQTCMRAASSGRSSDRTHHVASRPFDRHPHTGHHHVRYLHHCRCRANRPRRPLLGDRHSLLHPAHDLHHCRRRRQLPFHPGKFRYRLPIQHHALRAPAARIRVDMHRHGASCAAARYRNLPRPQGTDACASNAKPSV